MSIALCPAAAFGPDKDVTINEVRSALAQKGLTFGFGTIQRFFVGNGITRKKRQRTPPNKTVRIS